MIRYIHFLYFLILCAAGLNSYAKNSEIETTSQIVGYYQRINLDTESECNCKEKTDRTYELNKGLRPGDVTAYQLHAYQFKLGASTLPVSKLFKAFESDNSIVKISVKEWDAIMLLTTSDFEKLSFESAAKSIFTIFEPMDAAEFLRNKNTDAYTEYLNSLKKETNDPKESELNNQKETR